MEKSKEGFKKSFIVYCLIGLLLVSVGLLLFTGWGSKPETKKSFTIVILPDTQKYVLKGHYPEIFTNQTQWIAANKDMLNIKFVIHLGDIVDTWDSEIEWNYADASMSILDENNIPYSVVPGNHDHQRGNTDASAAYYNNYFSVSRFSDKDWWGGNYNRNENNYQLMTIEGNDFIFLSLDWCPSEDEIQWANDILRSFSERKAILTTHGYLDDKSSGRKGVHGCDDTNYIWNDLIKYYPNLQIVLCGHEHDEDGEALRTDLNLAGKPVYQILADYQGYSNGGDGWLRILKFVPSEDKIYVKTYSSYLNRYDKDETGWFALDYDI